MRAIRSPWMNGPDSGTMVIVTAKADGYSFFLHPPQPDGIVKPENAEEESSTKVTEGPTDSGTNCVITKEKKCKTPQKPPIREPNPAVEGASCRTGAYSKAREN